MLVKEHTYHNRKLRFNQDSNFRNYIKIYAYLTTFFNAYFQGEDRIFLNVRSSHRQSSHSTTSGCSSRKSSWKNSQHKLLFGDNSPNPNETVSLASSGSKQWTTITIPHNYIGSSWPIRVRLWLNMN